MTSSCNRRIAAQSKSRSIEPRNAFASPWVHVVRIAVHKKKVEYLLIEYVEYGPRVQRSTVKPTSGSKCGGSETTTILDMVLNLVCVDRG